MVSREFLGPANLAVAQILCIHKLTEVVIVSKDKNLIFTTLQVIGLNLESLNDGL